MLLRFRSLALISLAKCAAKDIPNSVASLEEVTWVTARNFCDEKVVNEG